MKKPLLVLEDTSPASRRALFRFAGVTRAATRYAWLSPLFWTALGVALAFAEQRNETLDGWVIWGTLFGFDQHRAA